MGVISEEANELNTVKQRLLYSESLHMGSGQKTALSTSTPQVCVEEPKK